MLITTSGNIASSERFTVVNENEPFSLDDIYEADIHINPGNSGGPVFTRDNRAVIGICVSYENAPIMFPNNAGPALAPEGIRNGQLVLAPIFGNSGIAYVVPSEYIINLLKANNLAFSAFAATK